MQVILSQDAQKQFQRLSPPVRKKVKGKLEALKNNALAGKKLAGELQGYRSVRAWPYRIIYEVNTQRKVIFIHKIAHRQGAYK